MTTRTRSFLALPLLMSCASGAGGPTSPGGSAGSSPAAQSFAGCRAETIEEDLRPTPVEMATKADAVAGGTYLISTTYLALVPDPDQQATFRADMGRLLESLPSAPGLIAFRFATSERCLSARTLAVWKDRASMRAFVNTPAHRVAMRHINALSRGDSTFLHWEGGLETAEWARAAQELARGDGPRL